MASRSPCEMNAKTVALSDGDDSDERSTPVTASRSRNKTTEQGGAFICVPNLSPMGAAAGLCAH